MMFDSLLPEDIVSSVYDIDFEALYESGYRLVLFDIDNTLVPHDAPADERACKFFERLRNIGFIFMFLSNNSEPRVKTFCEAVQGDGYLYKCAKPSPDSYMRAMEMQHLSKEQTLFFGDQIFTDVWGAKKCGIRHALIRPIKKWHEPSQIILKRLIEPFVMLFYPTYKARLSDNKNMPLRK